MAPKNSQSATVGSAMRKSRDTACASPQRATAPGRAPQSKKTNQPSTPTEHARTSAACAPGQKWSKNDRARSQMLQPTENRHQQPGQKTWCVRPPSRHAPSPDTSGSGGPPPTPKTTFMWRCSDSATLHRNPAKTIDGVARVTSIQLSV